jgi:Zn-finger nucleic acid-binding protein
MDCPECQTPLQDIDYKGVEISYCPQCESNVINAASSVGSFNKLAILMREKYNDHPAAMALLAKAELAAPQEPATKYNIACLLALDGKPQEAVAKLGEALAAGDSELRDNARTDTCFESLREDQAFQELTSSKAEPSSD